MDYNIFKTHNKMLILEKGINTDYIYSLLISLFYADSESIKKIFELYFVNITDENMIFETIYIQEFIKTRIINPLKRGYSIKKNNINILRMFLYHIGFLNNADVLDKPDISNFYSYLISNIFNYTINFEIVNAKDNVITNYKLDYININIKDEKKIIDLSSEINKWIGKNIIKPNYYYKFKDIPMIIPIKINHKNCFINIMNGFKFDSNSDNIQKSIIFEIHSLICKDDDNNYYSIIKHNKEWIGFSDNRTPSNFVVDMKNIEQVKNIMYDICFVFYKS